MKTSEVAKKGLQYSWKEGGQGERREEAELEREEGTTLVRA